ncbi:reverse transcriptase domain-containing protein [Tanacetum coccineum]|uniref:Reverse transcriptase domain-containing protein n=1 Tax=Tanacetum coccineum TaxID=301880 RepID=A0ABQ5IG88_9ASTR
MASTSFAHLSKQVLVEELKEKSVNESEVLAVVEEEGDSWITPIHEYLTDETLPAERKKARAIKRAKDCEYTGPTMHEDARALIRACQECQVHKPVPRNPQEKLNLITSPWPFYKWGIDIAGPFPEGPRKVKFLIVVVDYFTKWIEAKPIATITGNQVKKFVWGNHVCDLVICGVIISDKREGNRRQPIKDCIADLELLEEKREQAAIAEAKSKRQMEKYYNAKVRNIRFKPGDLVMLSTSMARRR